MAPTSSLLGLFNQLQSMEHAITAVLMESAAKLCSLTDANVFFLVETPEGRKFSGKRHLCEAYVTGALTPSGADVELEVDPSVTSLRERPLDAGDFGVNAKDFSNGSGFVAGTFPSHHSNFNEAGASTRGFAKKRSYFVKNKEISSGPAKFARADRYDGIKRETNSEDAGSLESTITLDDDVLIEASSTTASTPYVDDDFFVDPSTDRSMLPYIDTLGGFDEVDNVTPTDDLVATVQSRISPTKLEAFGGICDASVYAKGSVVNRLAVSVCYDFGKALAEMKPAHYSETKSKAFLKSHFDRWILGFENFRPFLDVMIPNGNPEKGVQFSVMGMLRKAARSGYTSVNKTVTKLRNLSFGEISF